MRLLSCLLQFALGCGEMAAAAGCGYAAYHATGFAPLLLAVACVALVLVGGTTAENSLRQMRGEKAVNPWEDNPNG